MKVAFFGTSSFGVPALEQLAAKHQVALCVTQPDRPQGRGLKPQPSPIRETAQRLNLPVVVPEKVREIMPELEQLACDVGVLASYGQLVPGALLRLPRHGILGIHPSLLPKHRGASPIVWPILQGDAETGVTIYRLVERLDAGEMLLQRATPIGPRETAAVLAERLSAWSGELIIEALALLDRGARWQAQDESHATYAPKLTKEQGTVDWQRDAATIDRMVRALNPWPGVATTWRGQPIKLWAVTPQPDRAAAQPGGAVLRASAAGIEVATGAGVVTIESLQPAGKRRMSAAEFLAGNSVRIGDVLGGGG